MRQFGEWIVTEGWEGVRGDSSPSEQVDIFEQIIEEKLNKFCPEKSIRLSSQDKPWVTGEIKAIDRQKSREYNRRGKTLKYKKLAKEFEQKYKKAEAKKYLSKNVDDLMECKPEQAYNVLKNIDSNIDSNTFTLPSHESESLTAVQSAERIATYLSQISQEFPPLDTAHLPARVQNKL